MRHLILMARISPHPGDHSLASFEASDVEAGAASDPILTYLSLRMRHNSAYTGRRRRGRGLGCSAGVCSAMSVANRNRSSTRKCERPADVRTNGSGGAMLVHAVGRYRRPPSSSRLRVILDRAVQSRPPLGVRNRPKAPSFWMTRRAITGLMHHLMSLRLAPGAS